MIRNENKGLRNKIKIAAWELECGWAEVEVGGDPEACRKNEEQHRLLWHHPEGSGLDL